MELDRDAIAKFKAIIRKDYGIELTDEEALDQAIAFYTMMKVVYRPKKELKK